MASRFQQAFPIAQLATADARRPIKPALAGCWRFLRGIVGELALGTKSALACCYVESTRPST